MLAMRPVTRTGMKSASTTPSGSGDMTANQQPVPASATPPAPSPAPSPASPPELSPGSGDMQPAGQPALLRAVTPCVDYLDYLRITLPLNRQHFSEYWIVTCPR